MSDRHGNILAIIAAPLVTFVLPAEDYPRLRFILVAISFLRNSELIGNTVVSKEASMTFEMAEDCYVESDGGRIPCSRIALVFDNQKELAIFRQQFKNAQSKINDALAGQSEARKSEKEPSRLRQNAAEPIDMMVSSEIVTPSNSENESGHGRIFRSPTPRDFVPSGISGISNCPSGTRPASTGEGEKRSLEVDNDNSQGRSDDPTKTLQELAHKTLSSLEQKLGATSPAERSEAPSERTRGEAHQPSIPVPKSPKSQILKTKTNRGPLSLAKSSTLKLPTSKRSSATQNATNGNTSRPAHQSIIGTNGEGRQIDWDEAFRENEMIPEPLNQSQKKGHTFPGAKAISSATSSRHVKSHRQARGRARQPLAEISTTENNTASKSTNHATQTSKGELKKPKRAKPKAVKQSHQASPIIVRRPSNASKSTAVLKGNFKFPKSVSPPHQPPETQRQPPMSPNPVPSLRRGVDQNQRPLATAVVQRIDTRSQADNDQTEREEALLPSLQPEPNVMSNSANEDDLGIFINDVLDIPSPSMESLPINHGSTGVSLETPEVPQEVGGATDYGVENSGKDRNKKDSQSFGSKLSQTLLAQPSLVHSEAKLHQETYSADYSNQQPVVSNSERQSRSLTRPDLRNGSALTNEKSPGSIGGADGIAHRSNQYVTTESIDQIRTDTLAPSHTSSDISANFSNSLEPSKGTALNRRLLGHSPLLTSVAADSMSQKRPTRNRNADKIFEKRLQSPPAILKLNGVNEEGKKSAPVEVKGPLSALPTRSPNGMDKSPPTLRSPTATTPQISVSGRRGFGIEDPPFPTHPHANRLARTLDGRVLPPTTSRRLAAKALAPSTQVAQPFKTPARPPNRVLSKSARLLGPSKIGFREEANELLANDSVQRKTQLIKFGPQGPENQGFHPFSAKAAKIPIAIDKPETSPRKPSVAPKRKAAQDALVPSQIGRPTPKRSKLTASPQWLALQSEPLDQFAVGLDDGIQVGASEPATSSNKAIDDNLPHSPREVAPATVEGKNASQGSKVDENGSPRLLPQDTDYTRSPTAKPGSNSTEHGFPVAHDMMQTKQIPHSKPLQPATPFEKSLSPNLPSTPHPQKGVAQISHEPEAEASSVTPCPITEGLSEPDSTPKCFEVSTQRPSTVSGARFENTDGASSQAPNTFFEATKSYSTIQEQPVLATAEKAKPPTRPRISITYFHSDVPSNGADQNPAKILKDSITHFRPTKNPTESFSPEVMPFQRKSEEERFPLKPDDATLRRLNASQPIKTSIAPLDAPNVRRVTAVQSKQQQLLPTMQAPNTIAVPSLEDLIKRNAKSSLPQTGASKRHLLDVSPPLSMENETTLIDNAGELDGETTVKRDTRVFRIPQSASSMSSLDPENNVLDAQEVKDQWRKGLHGAQKSTSDMLRDLADSLLFKLATAGEGVTLKVKELERGGQWLLDSFANKGAQHTETEAMNFEPRRQEQVRRYEDVLHAIENTKRGLKQLKSTSELEDALQQQQAIVLSKLDSLL